MRALIVVLIVVLVSSLLIGANRFLPQVQMDIHPNNFINGMIKYQAFALSLALMIIIISYFISPQSIKLMTLGDLKVLAEKETWLGINGKTSWQLNATQLLLFVSVPTAIFMFFAAKSSNSLSNFSLELFPLILLFSLMNSFSEEVIFRFLIHSHLSTFYSKLIVLLVSAVLFGLPHYFGFPTGIIGVLMAGVLGYILSKATYETNGLGIAWGVHFIQDVIIFTTVFMMKT